MYPVGIDRDVSSLLPIFDSETNMIDSSLLQPSNIFHIGLMFCDKLVTE